LRSQPMDSEERMDVKRLDLSVENKPALCSECQFREPWLLENFRRPARLHLRSCPRRVAWSIAFLQVLQVTLRTIRRHHYCIRNTARVTIALRAIRGFDSNFAFEASGAEQTYVSHIPPVIVLLSAKSDVGCSGRYFLP